MKVLKSAAVFALLMGLSQTSFATNDIRVEAVLQDPFIKSIVKNFKKYNGLNCTIAIEESGEKSVYFYDLDNISRYRVNYLCLNGKTLSVDGVFGDGMLTIEKVEFLLAN